jgi:hypothetical protein
MPSLLRAALVGSTIAPAAYAYTQANVASPFMYKNVDPIVFPGEYGKSHMHSFFGSDAVTASTTTSAELQKGCTTADNPNDFSVYCELRNPALLPLLLPRSHINPFVSRGPFAHVHQ